MRIINIWFLKMQVYFCLCGSSQGRIEELEEELEAERAMRAKVQLESIMTSFKQATVVQTCCTSIM